MLKKLLLSALIFSTASAAPVTYMVTTDQAKLNVMTAESETDLENFTAVTNVISGKIMFDAKAKTGSGEIKVDGKSIKTGVELRDEHMRGKDWFNFDKNPDVVFKSTKVSHKEGDMYDVMGNLTLNGITKPVSAVARVKLTKANEVTKQMKIAGDALAVRLTFDIMLKDFGIKHPALGAGRVSNKMPVTVKFIASDK